MAVRRTIVFPDLDGNMTEKEYYFQLGKTDALEMDITHEKDPAAFMKAIVEDKDSRKMLAVWKELLFRSVGVREGNRLVKNEDVLNEFRESGAYEQFFSDLIEMDDAGASFFVSIMPADIQKQVQEQSATRIYSKQELLDMTDAEFDAVAGTDVRNMTPEHMQIAFQRRSNSKAA